MPPQLSRSVTAASAPPILSELLVLACALALCGGIRRGECASPPARVLLLSVDGMHALDLARFIISNPNSAFAYLVQHGVNYTSAAAARPADSFPGMMAIATGGSPISTGVYFDITYDRSLWPPGVTNGPVGTIVTFNETTTFNPDALDGGGGLDPSKLPRDPARGGALVYPHNYLRVNTIFEIIKAAGYRTAWSDKHLADEMILGPSGQGVDDLYLLEINGTNAFGVSVTKSLDVTKTFDDMKVQGVLNQIKGLDHTGTSIVGVPAIFGMNFQAVSVAQRLKTNRDATNGIPTGAAGGPGGYTDGSGTPSFLLADALNYTDASIQKIIDALRNNGLLNSTYIILTAKHGQSPIDPLRINLIPPTVIPSLIDPSITHVLLTVGDDAEFLWLQDQTKTAAAVNVLLLNNKSTSADDIWANDELKLRFPDPLIDSRTPDIIALGKPGTIYTTAKKIAEHGGFGDTDVNVPIVISGPGVGMQTIKAPVTTAQIAPTILQFFGLNPLLLQAVLLEHTPVLPGFEPAFAGIQGPAIVSFGPRTNSPIQRVGGQSQFQITGVRTQTFTLQASTDLTNWSSISTNSFIVGGSTTFRDDTGKTLTNRFYRTIESN